MNAVFFPNWSNALSSSGLPPSKIQSHQIAIRWYLSYLKGVRQTATVETARRFVEMATEKRKPQPWMVESWKAGIRWFFVNAPIRKPVDADGKSACSKKPGSNETTAVTKRGKPGRCSNAPQSAEEWLLATRNLIRLRHLALETERSYLGWIERFFDYHSNCRPEELCEEHAGQFLEYLAAETEITASTQRGALNAIVFLLREVMKKELGDFSEYKRAKIHKNLPVVLSHKEVDSLLNAFPVKYRLMAQLQYGAGLRVNELTRLRIHPVRYQENGKTLRLRFEVAERHAVLCRLDQQFTRQAQAA